MHRFNRSGAKGTGCNGEDGKEEQATDPDAWDRESGARPEIIGAVSKRTSYLGPELQITGQIEGRGHIQVHCRIEGSVRGGRIVVGEGARIEGAVEAESLKVRGTVEGPIRANDVAIESTARVVGNVTHLKLSVEPGAYLEGCQPWRPRPLGKEQDKFKFAETD